MKNNKGSIKLFFERNKKKVAILGVTCTAFAMGWIIKGNIDSKIIKEMNSKMNALEKAYKEQDAFMRRIISIGTRCGNSECARQLSLMRWSA